MSKHAREVAAGGIPFCPWLPEVVETGPRDAAMRREKGEAFFLDAISRAQTYWVCGKPAQAVLQLDQAWMAELPDEAVAREWGAQLYRALDWILREAADGRCGFLGNPVRHFQHLASRMSGPRPEIRAWRAWLCLHLAERVLPGFPRDGRQIAREGLWIPGATRAVGEVEKRGWPGETAGLRESGWI